ncbi:helix-turn-helix transcriptional regulator [Larkinella soli]|uniref:helix-turn-helix transcriptional regulator n=1 Tax=Larkinella soli TaxID=1770527 RepID=UPI0013E3D49E|nr:AraC family transcriptional regulator [Larkinella soli]
MKAILNVVLNGEKEAIEIICHRMGVSQQDLYQYVCQALDYGIGYAPDQRLAEQARTIVLRRLDAHQSVQIEDVAEEMGLSVRSLQRRLQGEELTFREIIDQARRDVALRLIRTSRHNINEIASVMGYDEPSSFRRAFKKWTGQNPKAYQMVVN